MTVTITTTAGADYLWGNLSFTWDATEAGKSWQDASSTAFIAAQADTLSITPLESRIPEINKSETFGILDSRTYLSITGSSENIVISETYIDLIAFVLSVWEAVILNEVASRDVTQSPFLESLAVFDLVEKVGSVLSAEGIAFTDLKPIDFGQALAEVTSFSDLAPRLLDVSKNSPFGMSDDRIGLSVSESYRGIQFSETYTDLIAFIAQIAEQLSLSDFVSHSPQKWSVEQVSFIDRILRASGAVISDLAFRTTPLDEDGFAAILSEARPLGFGTFKDLTPGDYEYAKALVRLALQAPSISGSRIALTDARFIVDVPDIRDRGTTYVPVGGTTINFNQTFNAPPEVQATFKGGSALAVPEIGLITKTGFQLTLINPATQTTVAGNASWAAEGY